MRTIITALAISVLAGTPAYAQDAAAGSTSGSTAQNEVNVIAVTGDTGSSRVRSSGHIYSTPTVMGSSIIGSNNCLVGTGIGAAGGPLGLNISIGRSDKSCVRRMDAAALNHLGLRVAAIARLCQDDDHANADAFWAEFHLVCPGADRSRYKYSDGSMGQYWNGQ